MIAIVDYGAGNLVSVKKAFDWLGHTCEITADPRKVSSASRVVLPGVGHFRSTYSLTGSGLRDSIVDAIGRKVPFLGICVGMQWMFDGSQECPETKGLGVFRGECERFASSVKSPHVGWNSIVYDSTGSRLFDGLPPSSYLYFTHSFRAPMNPATVACCDYGGNFSAAVEQDNVFGVQFHPEKSGEIGLKLLANFCAF
jgi:imidazole glycerol-phosphate synthase subunit HisH